MAKTEEQKQFASYVLSLELYDVIVQNKKFSSGLPCCPNLSQLSNYLESNVIDDTKIYLRPMSDITDEEMKTLLNLDSGLRIHKDVLHDEIPLVKYLPDAIDYLNSRLLDYRGYIALGRAMPSLDRMYKELKAL